jgi:hypothetical protein
MSNGGTQTGDTTTQTIYVVSNTENPIAAFYSKAAAIEFTETTDQVGDFTIVEVPLH